MPRGSAFGYLGPNGAGKTTLIRTLLGLTRANDGTMSLRGISVPAERSKALARVGAIVDEPRFHHHLTGQENLRLLAAARGGDAGQRIAPSLARVGLADKAGDKVATYSMGMRQRLGVAACLLADPELLILDEPMNGLDPAGMHEMRAMIASLADEGRTVVLSSHLLDEVQRTCDAVAIVDHGRVIRQGPIDELIRGAGAIVVQIDCAGRPGPAAHRRGGHRRGHRPGPYRADRHPARGRVARGRRRPQPAAGPRRDRRLRPAGGPDVAGGLVLVRDEPTGRSIVTTTEPSLSEAGAVPGPSHRRAPRTGAWLPTWDLITTKNLEIRKRRGLMITLVVLIVVPTVLFYGLRLLFHAVDPHSYSLAGGPGFFSQTTNLTAEFGFIAAAALGAAAGTTDLSDGMFRHLVITGRSRLALYLARIPAGLAILIPMVALVFIMNCLVTSYESPPNPTTVSFYGVNPPDHLDQAELQTWLLQHQQQVANGFLPNVVTGPGTTPAQIRTGIDHNIASLYSNYTVNEIGQATPADNEMAKIGLWLELEVGIGFVVGLGFGALTGQRTTTTIVLIALEILVTPLFAARRSPTSSTASG